tara:strand:+ start:308 stop:580 length:273 start_codon:yes stop_codon:yes gene_type:complete
MMKRVKNIFNWAREVIRLSISVFLKSCILFWYSVLIYPCQVLLKRLNKNVYVKRESEATTERGNESKRVLKVNGTKIYHILYNKQREGNG